MESVQVTAVPARTANVPAVPREGADATEDALLFLRDSSDGEAEVALGEDPQAEERDAASETRKTIRATRAVIWNAPR